MVTMTLAMTMTEIYVCNKDLLFQVNPYNTLENVHTKMTI